MRVPHILEPVAKTSGRPKRVIYFDSESAVKIDITEDEINQAIKRKKNKQEAAEVRKRHDLYLICSTIERRGKEDINQTYTGKNAAANFWLDVHNQTRINQELMCIAHNAKYDVQVMGAVFYLVHLGYQVTNISDSNPFIMRLSKKEGEKKERKIIIISSTNYYQASLKELGKVFGLPKLDFDHGQEINPEDPAFMEKAIIYAKRDVEILKVAMRHFFDFVEREDLGKLALTIAGQSLQAFRKRFMKEDIYIHSNKEALEVERRAYAGGRNEVFTAKVNIMDRVFYVDINSMYPHVMKSFTYPKRIMHFWKTCGIEKVKNMIDKGYLICADCLVNTDIPIFHKKEKKLIFPTGTFRTTLSTPEIKEAIRRGFLVDIRNVCVYEPARIFEEYVDFFYKNRLAAKKSRDRIHDLLYKLFMNALYGKFGQKNIKTERVGDANDPYEVRIYTAIEEGKVKTFKVFGGGIFTEIEDPNDLEAHNSFPAIAAHVTAYARMLLHSYIEIAGRDNVHYTDTDSLIVNGEGFQNLLCEGAIDNKRLGALKLELTTDKGFLFHGCKDYEYYEEEETPNTSRHRLDNEPIMKLVHHAKMKGVTKSAVRIADSGEGYHQYVTTQWGGFTDRLRSGDFTSYHNTVRIKTLSRQYDKGEISENGRVIPFTFSEVDQVRNIQDEDYILYLCRKHGFPKCPGKGERYHGEYLGLSARVKARYFRIDSKLNLDEFCDMHHLSVNELFDQLRAHR